MMISNYCMHAFPRQKQEKEDNTISPTIFSTHLGPCITIRLSPEYLLAIAASTEFSRPTTFWTGICGRSQHTLVLCRTCSSLCIIRYRTLHNNQQVC